MADSVEQEIKVKLKAVLEGFDALKKVKDDVKGIFNDGNNGKIFEGASKDAKTLVNSINQVNKSIQELPANMAKADKQSRGLVSTIRELFTVGGEIGQFISGIISLIKFFGITGEQIKQKLGSAFAFIKGGASEAFAGLKGLISEVQGAITGLFSGGGASGAASAGAGGLRTALAGLGQSLTSLLPALAGAGAGIAAIGVVAGSVIAVVAALAAAIAGVVAVAGGVALAGTVGSAGLLALAASGFEYLETLEKIELGTGALIAQLSEIKREGLTLTGIEKVEAGIELGREALAKLRVDAIQTTATYETLAGIFQAAVGRGLGAGLNLDEIRKLTVGLSQAGAALNVPYDQMRQEVNSILEGSIDINSVIAKSLGITNEQVKNWKEQGKLADELNKRLESFNIAGVKAAATLAGLKSNLKEALNVFSGEATTKAFEQLKERLSKTLSTVFDFKAGGLDKAFKPIAELIDKVLVQSINRFADWIDAAVGFAKELGKFLESNKGTIDDILTLVDSITRDVVGLVADIFGLTSDTKTWKSILEIIRAILKVVSGIVRVIRSEVQILANGFRAVANVITGNLIPAMDSYFAFALPGLREMISLLGSISGLTSQKAGDGLFGGISDGLGNAFSKALGTDKASGSAKGKLTYKGNKNPGAKKKGGGGKDAAKQIADAYSDLESTRIENAYNEYIANLRREEAALDESYKQRLISTDEYYAEKQKAAKLTIDAEIAKEQFLLDLAKKKRARATGTAEGLQAQAELEQIESRINVLVTEVGAKQAEIDRQKADAIKELTDSYNELKNVLFEIEGLGFEASVNRIDEKYKELLERATADGKTEVVEIINKLKAHEKTVARLTDNEKNYNIALNRRNDALEQIQELVESGAINEEQAGQRRIAIEREYKGELLDVIAAMITLAQKAKDFDRVIALQAAKRKIENSGDFTTPELLEQERKKFDRLRASLSVNQNAVGNQVETGAITSELGDVKRLENERKLKAELQASVNLMRELALATASLDDDIAVENLALEIQNLGLQTDTLGKGIIDSLRDGIGGFFEDLITGAQSLTQAFRGMVSSILASIARLAANELLRSLFSSGIFKQGGALGFLSGLKFAEGGHITGQGTGVSDSIPIMASNGEYMIKAATVRKLGVGFLDKLNSGNIAGLFGKFAAGGAIGSSGSTAQTGAGESASNNGVRIINVIDPALVKDYLASSSGESTILNVLKRNPNYIKQLLA